MFVFTLHHFKQKNIRKNTQPGMVSRIIIEYTFCFLFVMYGRNIRPIIKLLQLQCRLLEDQQLITLL